MNDTVINLKNVWALNGSSMHLSPNMYNELDIYEGLTYLGTAKPTGDCFFYERRNIPEVWRQ